MNIKIINYRNTKVWLHICKLSPCFCSRVIKISWWSSIVYFGVFYSRLIIWLITWKFSYKDNVSSVPGVITKVRRYYSLRVLLHCSVCPRAEQPTQPEPKCAALKTRPHCAPSLYVIWPRNIFPELFICPCYPLH